VNSKAETQGTCAVKDSLTPRATKEASRLSDLICSIR
jgi:hypothetical protein